MDLREAVAVLVAGILALTMADGLVLISPFWQAGIDIVLIGNDQRPLRNRCCNDWLDCFLLNIGQHAENHVSTPLDQAQDRRLFLFQRATATRSLEPSAPSVPAFF